MHYGFEWWWETVQIAIVELPSETDHILDQKNMGVKCTSNMKKRLELVFGRGLSWFTEMLGVPPKGFYAK